MADIGAAVQDKPRETTGFPLEMPPPLAAAAFLAVLAYPDNFTRRDEVLTAFRGWYAKVGIANRKLKRKDMPGYASMRARDVGRALEKALYQRIARRRFPVVNALLERMICASRGHPQQTMEPFFESIVRQRRPWQHRDAVGEDQGRHAVKIWAETKPVLHLAMALQEATAQLTFARRKEIGDHTVAFDSRWLFYQADRWVFAALKRAETQRHCLIAAAGYLRLRLKSADTICLLTTTRDGVGSTQ